MKLTIIFIGLISHFSQPGRIRSVLVAEPHHEPRMVISVSDLLDPAQATKFATVASIDTEWIEWNLEGTHLKFQKLPNGSPAVDQTIPSLVAISDGSRPLVKIENGVLHSRTSAYIDYTGGSLSADGFGCSIRWAPPRPPRQDCMPSATWKTGLATPIVGYTGDTNVNDPPYILNGSERLDLKPNAVVWIANVSMKGNSGPHHKDYLWLLDDGNCIDELRGKCPSDDFKGPLFGTSADLHLKQAALILPPNLVIFDVANTECTNSRFP